MNKLIILLVICIFMCSITVLSTGTCTINKQSYFPGSNAVFSCSCTATNEQNIAGTIRWVNMTKNKVLRTVNVNTGLCRTATFGDTYAIPDAAKAGKYNVTLKVTGTGFANWYNTDDLRNQTFQVAGIGVRDILVTDFNPVNLTCKVHKTCSVDFKLENSFNRGIGGAMVRVEIVDNKGEAISNTGEWRTSDGNGKVFYSTELSSDFVDEKANYRLQIRPMCLGSNSSEAQCYDINGIYQDYKAGSAQFLFNTSAWGRVDTKVDRKTYLPKEPIFICANITNFDQDYEYNTKVYYNYRCDFIEAKGYKDQYRALLGETTEYRSISANTTRNQCARFVLPENPRLQGRNSSCYAATYVTFIDNEGHEASKYNMLSNNFFVNSTEVNVNADWQWVGDYKLNAVVNMSDPKYREFNATNHGNIDIRLIDLPDQNTNIPAGINVYSLIKDINVSNASIVRIDAGAKGYLKNHKNFELEFLEDGFTELEIRKQDMRPRNGFWNITVQFYDFTRNQTASSYNLALNQSVIAREMKNQSASLYDIANKTGTFYFDFEIPGDTHRMSSIPIVIHAQRELGQGTIEGHFQCYIDGYKSDTVDQWTHAVSDTTEYNSSRLMYVPSNIPLGTHSVVCKLGTTSFTNLIHTATKVITITDTTSSAGSSGSEDGAVKPMGTTIEFKESLTAEKEQVPGGITILFAVFLLASMLFSRLAVEEEKEETLKHSNNDINRRRLP